MALYLGIDGGGTKTLFMLADASGHILSRARLPGIDFTQIGMAGVAEIIRQGSQEVLQQAGARPDQLAAVCAGVPCLGEYDDWDEACPVLFGKIFPSCPVRCVNDSFVALFGALTLQPGIHLVAGTGSIAAGRNAAGMTARCGGWHAFFSDEGSCYWLGQKACSLFVHQSDGRVPRGALHARMSEALGLKRDMDLNRYYLEHLKDSREKVAALQLLLFDAAADGDPSAIAAYRDAAAELSAMVKALRGQLGFQPDETVAVSTTGGLFRAGQLILEPLQQLLTWPQYRLVEPAFRPAAGALLGAYDLDGTLRTDLTAMIRQLNKEEQHHDRY